MRTHVNITRINKIEAMYGRSRVNFKVELRSTCTFVGSFSYIASMLFTGIKFTSRTYSRENYAVVEVDFHCVNEIEAMYESPRVNVKVERGSAFRYMLDLPYNVSILRTRVRFTCLRREKLLYPTVEIHLYAVVARGLPPEFYLPGETKQ